MTPSLILPGINGSDGVHWQTAWERGSPAASRIRPASWDAPDREDWIRALDRALADAPAPPLLIAHSLGCLLVAHWAARAGNRAVRGAFLVAVPDPAGEAFPHAAASFRAPPDGPLPFPSLIVASEDDPYASPDFARSCARAWGSGLAVAGRLGHINSESGLGAWPQGRTLFEAFAAGTGAGHDAAG